MRRSDFKLESRPMKGLLRRVIHRLNGNFPGFMGIFLKIAKNSYEAELANKPITRYW